MFICKYYYYINIIYSKKNIVNKNQILLRDYCHINKDSLKKLPKKKNHRLILKERYDFFKYISKCAKREINEINSIFISHRFSFGNQLIFLNKVIFLCEILKCERIILDKEYFWFIKNKIIDKEYNMTIEVGEVNDYINKNVILDYSENFFWYYHILEPKYRPELVKNEILNNLPKINSNPNDLYIYVRSGDIFESFMKSYYQPPLCFYQELLNNFKFNNTYIIAENNNNPVIDKLLKQYPNIIYRKNPLKFDIAYLIYAYNLVGTYSSFISHIIKYNDNLKKFWYFHFKITYYFYIYFYFVFNHPIKKYIMKESDYYKQIKNCNNVECQKRIMIDYKCPNKININIK